MYRNARPPEIFLIIDEREPRKCTEFTVSYEIQRLSRFGEDIDQIKNQLGQTPIEYAVQKIAPVQVVRKIFYAQKDSFENAKRAANIAFDANNFSLVKFFIREGFYDLANNQNPQIADDSLKTISEYAIERARLLHGACAKADCDEILKIMEKNPVCDYRSTVAFVGRVLFLEQEVDFSKVAKVMNLFFDSGVKINRPMRNFKDDTLLEMMCEKITDAKFFQNKTAEERATKIAIILLENSAGFNLRDLQKQILVKAILQHDAKYIETLIKKKRFITPDFQIDGKPLRLYAQDVAIDDGVANFIKTYDPEFDANERRKKSLLTKPIVLQVKKEGGREPAARRFEEIVRGKDSQGPMEFYTDIESGRKFAKIKARAPIEKHYGGLLLRALSRDEYVVKRSAIIVEGDQKHFVLKWDEAIADRPNEEIVLLGRDAKNFKVDRKKYARLYGVMAVLGEKDWNPYNTLLSEKNNRPTRIDNSPLFNDALNQKGYRIFGSTQSLCFLWGLAGDGFEDISAALSNLRENDREGRGIARSYVGFEGQYQARYNRPINKNLLEKIKQNIAGNPESAEEFMAFMEGVQDAIDLASDADFLNSLEEKYQSELDEDSRLRAKKCRKAFAENAQMAECQYKEFLEFYHILKAKNLYGEDVDKIYDGFGELVECVAVEAQEKIDDFFTNKAAGRKLATSHALELFLNFAKKDFDKDSIKLLFERLAQNNPQFKDCILAELAVFSENFDEEKIETLLRIFKEDGLELQKSCYFKESGELRASAATFAHSDKGFLAIVERVFESKDFLTDEQKKLFDLLKSGAKSEEAKSEEAKSEEVLARIRLLQRQKINPFFLTNSEGENVISFALKASSAPNCILLIEEALQDPDFAKHFFDLKLAEDLLLEALQTDNVEMLNYLLESGILDLENFLDFEGLVEDWFLESPAKKECQAYKIFSDTSILLGSIDLEPAKNLPNANLRAKFRISAQEVFCFDVVETVFMSYLENISQDGDHALDIEKIEATIREFVRKGVKINPQNHKENPLSCVLSCSGQNVAIVAQALLNCGANRNYLKSSQIEKLDSLLLQPVSTQPISVPKQPAAAQVSSSRQGEVGAAVVP